MTEPTVGYVHSLESFGSVDGPGIRFVSFLQGCRMRCQFCHNPDTWKINAGTPYTAKELFNEAIKYRPYWRGKGGVTCSGGEPLLQIDFLIEYFTLCKKHGVNTTLDSCGAPFNRDPEWLEKFDRLLEVTDLILLDIKQINPERHRKLTTWKNDTILDMAQYLKEKGQPIWIRHVLVPTRSDFDEDLEKLSEYIESLGDIVKKVEILPYHTMGVYKYREMGIRYPLDGVEPPTEDRVANANRILKTEQYQGYREM
ncbi:pyruvate formate lyase-activating enzyme 1 [Aerococcus urinaehominis]|uniref:Pyruvate formate-lyase-activating enzyme n=1 Tax=Aerococcus urinaehominis TaxID=128944 RepID=A0A0X8FJY5_9LACT|nr:pyruvate formate-lyase-activating protein [Aerococcus urinaehominis]AMB98685.1 pyruvate formate lyase-activating enzyme 1 [Aerococcus urinaehominis]SDL98637.1 pyruvate formate lyase activating enzyme [Aerococcus urinaehominis]